MTEKNDKTLSETLFVFNNRIVGIKDIIKKAKIFQNTKIARQIKLLVKKKGNEAQLEKNKRKCQHLKEEIDFIKKQKFNEIAIFAFDNDETSFDQFIKANNVFLDKKIKKNLNIEKIALARVAFSKPIQKAIGEIKNDPKIPNWKEVFIKYKARCEKRKNWKEKTRLLKEIETKLKPDKEESDQEESEKITENSCQEVSANESVDENVVTEKIEQKSSIEKDDSEISEGYNSHDDDKWNNMEEDSPSQSDESVDLSEKFVFSKSNLKFTDKKQDKNLKPLVIGEKPSHMLIKQINLDEIKDYDELPVDENKQKIELQETLKAVDDPFFLDQNGNEIQGNDDFRYSSRKSYDFEPVSYSSYDNYKKKREDFRDKRREMGRNSFKNSLSNDSRPFRKDFDRQSNFKNFDRPVEHRKKLEFKKNFDNKPKEDISKLHPSWQAKKLSEEKAKSMKFEGKKIKFDDDE